MTSSLQTTEGVFARNRAFGHVALSVAARAGGTHRTSVAEEGSLRVRFPNSTGAAEAVLINTAGGIAGGDRFDTAVSVGKDASLTVTTAAAEKVYRSLGSPAAIAVTLVVESGASLSWLPQETILFDQARLDRTLTAEVASDARLVLAEALVFGRAAMGETVANGSLMDRWRIRRDRRLIYAEGIRLGDDIAAMLRPAAAVNGGAAIATVLVTPCADDIADAVRAQEPQFRGEVGISAWNGLAVIRMVARDGAAVRHDLMTALRTVGCPLPRLWLN